MGWFRWNSEHTFLRLRYYLIQIKPKWLEYHGIIKGEVRVFPVHAMQAYKCVKVRTHSFLTSALHKCEWSANRPSNSNSKEYEVGWILGNVRKFCRKEQISCPAEIRIPYCPPSCRVEIHSTVAIRLLALRFFATVTRTQNSLSASNSCCCDSASDRISHYLLFFSYLQ
jgi:hypothetical protein